MTLRDRTIAKIEAELERARWRAEILERLLAWLSGRAIEDAHKVGRRRRANGWRADDGPQLRQAGGAETIDHRRSRTAASAPRAAAAEGGPPAPAARGDDERLDLISVRATAIFGGRR